MRGALAPRGPSRAAAPVAGAAGASRATVASSARAPLGAVSRSAVRVVCSGVASGAAACPVGRLGVSGSLGWDAGRVEIGRDRVVSPRRSWAAFPAAAAEGRRAAVARPAASSGPLAVGVLVGSAGTGVVRGGAGVSALGGSGYLQRHCARDDGIGGGDGGGAGVGVGVGRGLFRVALPCSRVRVPLAPLRALGSSPRSAPSAKRARGSTARSRSALKRARKSERQRRRNQARRSEVKTRIRAVFRALEAWKTTPPETMADLRVVADLMALAYKAIDKATMRNVLHRNAAARRKSSLAVARQKLLDAHGLAKLQDEAQRAWAKEPRIPNRKARREAKRQAYQAQQRAGDEDEEEDQGDGGNGGERGEGSGEEEKRTREEGEEEEEYAETQSGVRGGRAAGREAASADAEGEDAAGTVVDVEAEAVAGPLLAAPAPKDGQGRTGAEEDEQ